MPTTSDLLGKATKAIDARRRLPEATYRLQFHAGFTFRDAAQIVPYLRDLGISHVYASPFLKARPGSTHGYDITDHGRLNPEIGSDDEFAHWVKILHEHELGQFLDIVPNHMGIVGNENPWWNDILENGPASAYAAYFDVGWYSSPRPELLGRVLIPVLGDPYGKVLESGQLRLGFAEGAFSIHYFEHRFPVDPRTYDLILRHRLDELGQSLPADDSDWLEYQSILTAVSHFPARTETAPAQVAERQREKEVIKRRLAAVVAASPAIAIFLEANLALFNGKPDQRHSFDLLDNLLDRQAYRLSFWRVASDEINYRRFFDVNELAAISVEREEVFRATHELILKLLVTGSIDGLRIDHPDGLYDPRQYLQRLQQSYVMAHCRHIFDNDPDYRDEKWPDWENKLLAETAQAVREGQTGPLWRSLYVVVEKILGAGEHFPEEWSVHGTSGYDFLSMINGLLVRRESALALTHVYTDWIGDASSFAEIGYRMKLLIPQASMSSELYMLSYQLDRLAQKDRWSRDFSLNSLRQALTEVIACFPVYRSYISEAGVREPDRRNVEIAVQRAITRNSTMSRLLFHFVRNTLLLKFPDAATVEDKAEQTHFVGKFQQVSAPVMAKGVEDTAFYVYNRLLSLNEVGGDPGRFGVPDEALHRYLQERQAKWPFGLSPLSTHDTKRSEDVRARLNVLSELPDEWREAVLRWSLLNAPLRGTLAEMNVPDANEEYFLYQTLLGAWPIEGGASEEAAHFVERIQNYMIKALHESKVHTSWVNPNPEYDEAIRAFVARILDAGSNGPFLDDFRTFQKRISHYGFFNSLSQTLLRITSPGVPDTYQGTEIWDYSLVDPDNRRPVDYERRRRMLGELQKRVAGGEASQRTLVQELTQSKEDGRIKLYVTWQALRCRRDRPGLFTTGSYEPLEAAGAKREHVFAFRRRDGDRQSLVVVPRLCTRLASSDGPLSFSRDAWEDTRLLLSDVKQQKPWRNVFTGETLRLQPQGLFLADVLALFPVALYTAT